MSSPPSIITQLPDTSVPAQPTVQESAPAIPVVPTQSVVQPVPAPVIPTQPVPAPTILTQPVIQQMPAPAIPTQPAVQPVIQQMPTPAIPTQPVPAPAIPTQPATLPVAQPATLPVAQPPVMPTVSAQIPPLPTGAGKKEETEKKRVELLKMTENYIAARFLTSISKGLQQRGVPVSVNELMEMVVVDMPGNGFPSSPYIAAPPVLQGSGAAALTRAPRSTTTSTGRSRSNKYPVDQNKICEHLTQSGDKKGDRCKRHPIKENVFCSSHIDLKCNRNRQIELGLTPGKPPMGEQQQVAQMPAPQTGSFTAPPPPQQKTEAPKGNLEAQRVGDYLREAKTGIILVQNGEEVVASGVMDDQTTMEIRKMRADEVEWAKAVGLVIAADAV